MPEALRKGADAVKKEDVESDFNFLKALKIKNCFGTIRHTERDRVMSATCMVEGIDPEDNKKREAEMKVNVSYARNIMLFEVRNIK